MKQKSLAGFTLLELLVAVAITLVLSGLMLAVVTSTLTLWQRTQNNFTQSAQAGLALDLIERDLQAAVFRQDGQTWLAVDILNSATALTPHGWLTLAAMKPATAESQRFVPDLGDGFTPLIRNARFGLSGTWLRFITTHADASDGSLPIAVSYQIARRPVSGTIAASNQADVRYTLFRSAVGASSTFSTGNDVTVAGFVSSSVTPAASRNPRTLMNPNSVDALATNVVDFGVWLYVRETNGVLRRIFPGGDTDLVHAAHELGVAPDAERFPEIVDVMVRILSDQGATLLAEMENGAGRMTRPSMYASDAEWWWGIVEANSQVYVRRIAIRSSSL